MSKTIAAIVLGIFLGMLSSPSSAANCNIRYEMRVDGLACPYCAYGIEKKLKAINGVENLDVNLDAGIVRVDVIDGIELNEADMKQLFNDAGFTYRSMKITHLDRDQATEQE